MTFKEFYDIEGELNLIQRIIALNIGLQSKKEIPREATRIEQFILTDARALVVALKEAMQKISELEERLLCSPQKSRVKKR